MSHKEGLSPVATKKNKLRNGSISHRGAVKSASSGDRVHSYLLENCPIGLALCRMDGTLTEINPAYAEIIGRTVAETLNLTYWEITPQKYAPQEQIQLESLEKSGRYGPYEKEYIHQDGHLVPVRLKGQIVEIAGERLIWSSVENITDRKNLEEELIKERDFNKSIIDACPAFILTLDAAGKTQMMNPAMLNALGYNLDEVLGTDYLQTFVPETDRSGIYKNIEQLTTTGKQSIHLNRLITKTNENRLVEWHGRLVQKCNNTTDFIMAVGIDISDRASAEQALYESEQRFRATFEQAAIGICHIALDGRWLLVNQRLCNLLGYNRAELLALTFQDITHPEDLDADLGYVRQLLAGEIPRYSMEKRYICKDGGHLWVQLTVSLVRDTAGNPKYFISAISDISDRKVAEFTLKEYQEHLEDLVAERTGELRQINEQLQDKIVELQLAKTALGQQARILNQIHDAVISCDLNGIINSWNKGAERVYGYSEAEAIGQNIALLYTADCFSWIQREIIPTVFAKGSNEAEIKALRKSGKPIDIHVSLSLLQDRKGNTIGIVGYSMDISDRKSTEEALRSSEEKYRSIVETCHEGIWTIDMENKTTFVNEKMADMLGYQVDEIIGKSMFAFMDEEGIALARAKIERRRLGIGEQYDFKLSRKDGSDLWVILSSNPILDEQKQYLGAFAMLTDITDRKQTEEALRRSETALRHKAMRETLFNSLAKQIRNSLDLTTILQTAVQEIRHLMQVDWCIFGWYRLKENPPIWEGLYEAKNPALPSLLASYPIDLNSALVQQNLQLQIVRIDDVRTIDEADMRNLYLSFDISSCLSLPIASQLGDIGVIGCNHSQQLRPWSDSEVELLLAVADQLAIAIDQARLYEQTRIAATQAQAQAQQLEQTLQQLQRTQTQLIQTEKMSSLGQLVAGVAHEINNPVNFIYGNLNPANEYIQDLLNLLELYQQTYPDPTTKIEEKIEDIDLDFLREDLPKLMNSMKIGADRIREIVLSLRTFSRLDEADMKEVDIHEGIDSTLLILQNRLKAKPDRPAIDVIKQYGKLPLVECYPGQLNQVFMNIITNAIDALDESKKTARKGEIISQPNIITITTEVIPNPQNIINNTDPKPNGKVIIRLADNGIGINEEVRKRLFDPFFTTKSIGKGTGLGLAISYQIIVEKHRGTITCNSVPGQGSEFAIEIPIQQS